MVTLNFTLTPESASKVHDIIACLGKFSEMVSIEAQRERLAFMTLNSSKTAYAAFYLDASKFFSRYEFVPGNASVDGRFTCSMLNKALLSVFKARLTDTRGKNTAIDKCEVSVLERPDETACRFIVKMICHHGVTKKYQLTYESVEVMRALFDKSVATNRWKIRSAVLKEFTEFFGLKTEQLDIYPEGGKVTFMSFTEKITNSKQEILKQPLQTSVSVHAADFEEFKAQERMHIIISVKDFKSIANHAATLDTSVLAYYSQPSRPMQLCYGVPGLQCEFTLMTIGNPRDGATPTPAPVPAPTVTTRAQSHANSTANERSASSRLPSEMPKAPTPAARTAPRQLRAVGPGAQVAAERQPDEESDSLFVPQEDDDTRWDPPDYAADEEENLGWDASADNNLSNYPVLRDSSHRPRPTGTGARFEDEGIAPTQRVSQIPGALW